MNNMLKSLLVTALAISASHVSAYTNRNFLSDPRPQNASLLLDSAVAHDLAKTNKHDRFGGNFMVRGYYSESTNSKELGKFFGVNEKNVFNATAVGNAATGTVDVNAAYMLHDLTSGAAVIVAGTAIDGATINLAPKTVSYGVEFGYVQCLGKILDGLHLSISLPVERVENNMNLGVTAPINARDTKIITDFLAGNVNIAADGGGAFDGVGHQGGQAKLTNALMDGNKQTQTGIADIQAVLGYDFVRNEDWTAGLNIGMAIPTGNTATGKNVFEAIYGNGGHWELGLGGKVQGRLWHDGDQHIGLNLQADYRYGFQANEKRTLSTAANFSKYFLLGKVAAGNVATLQLNPTANLSTVDLSVSPNSAVRGNLGLNYGNGGFVFGVAYAPAWKQAETVKFNGTFADDAYGLVASEADSAGAAPFTLAAVPAALATVGVKKADLVLDSATRPSQVAHRLGGDMGYTFKNWEFPVTIGAGGHYELAGDNAVAQNWGAHLTAGIGF